MKRLKILVSAYACAPNRGSEPGVGWNFVKGLQESHEVHVIVEKRKWEKPIMQYLEEYPDFGKHVKFYFIDKQRNKWLRKIWPPSYYWYYREWQRKAFKLAMDIDSKEDFDIIHQLTMVGYREPGYLWKLGKPFVWGPIGGLENSPWKFLPSLGLKGFIYYVARNIMNIWQRSTMYRPRKAAQLKHNALIAAGPGGAKIINDLWGEKASVICEVGKEEGILARPLVRMPKEQLKIVWSGVHNPGKNLPLLLHALSDVSFPYKLQILGQGQMTDNWKSIAKKLNVDASCIWNGWLEREEAMGVFRSNHVFVITSISDLTATVTLEALSYGLPIICLDHLGFAYVVTNDCGIKIPITSPKQAAHDIAEALKKLFYDENFRQTLSKGALKRVEVFSWSRKIKKLNGIYVSLLGESDNN